VQLDGEPVAPEVFAEALARVEAASAGLEESPTQFEALTATAFCVLADAGVDASAIEAGLGGRHDATRVVRARTVGLTSIGLDHTAVLGETRPEILAEKLAVLEPGSTLCLGLVDDEIASLAGHLAGAARALVRRVSRDEADALPLAVGFQRENAALALALAESHLLLRPFDRAAAIAALEGAAPPGRMEVVAGDPLVLLDGAHNLEGMRALVAELAGALGDRSPRIALIALQDDKPVDAMLAALRPAVDRIIGTESGHAGHARSLPAGRISELAFADPSDALAEARRLAGPGGAVIVCGSLYLLARLRAEEAQRA
jgi:dihydrofolate synthase / folylpolyglutamate synthase